MEAELELLRNALAGQDQVQLIDAFGGHDEPSLEMYLEVTIVCLRDKFGCHDRGKLEKHLEDMIE